MSTTPRRIGKYELQKQLGRGSAGEVWKGYDPQLQREVAVKLIHPDLQSDPNFMTRFVEEGEAVTALQHDNIVQVREVNVFRPAEANAPTAYLIMDYIEGQSLADYIGKTARASHFPAITDIAYLFSSLGSAVDYLHQNDIVAGNIKPDNILLDQHSTGHLPAGEPMLVDFAMRTLLGTGTAPSPLYLSPEQAKGQPAIPHSDIYALGVILYELCTGVQPFRGESPVAIMMQHLNILPTPPTLINPNVPAELSEVILRALAKDPETRYPTASLLAAAIVDACSLEDWRIGSFHRILAVEQARRTGELSRIDGSGPLPSTSILGVPVSTPPSLSRPLPSINPSTFFPAAAMASNTNPGHPAVSKPPLADMPKRNSMPVAAVRPTIAPAEPTSARTGPMPNMNAPSWTRRTSQQIPVVVSPPVAPVPVPVPATPPLSPVSTYSAPIAVPGQRPAIRARRRNMRAFYLVSAAVVLILAALLGTVLFIHSAGPAASPGTLVGHVFFQDDALGRDDTLRIELQGIPDAPQGQVYAAWLEMHNGQAFFLGKPTPNNGTITWTYASSSHTNLLATTQGFSITLESSGSAFRNPAGSILYKGSFEQASFSYIKNVLYQLPGFPDKAGILSGMFNTIKSINDKAGSIDDSLQVQHMHDYGLVMRQAARILQLVDGAHYALSSGDLPASAPVLLSNTVGLISSPAQIGYLDALAAQMNKISQTTQDPAIRQHVRNVQNAITDLRGWIQNMRVYVIQLLKAPGQQTGISATPPSADQLNAALLLKKASDDSYTGRTIPPNESPLPIPGSAGAYQAYIECQYMATLNVIKM